MPNDHSVPETRPPGARALGAASGRECPGCGKRLTDRQKACSAKCRATLSRRRRSGRLETRDLEIRGLLEAALKKLEDAR
jgi:predicted nucleic acid-binding Zn ribbon protein